MTVGEWKKDFMAFINELNLPRDDYKGIVEYIADGCALMKEQKKQIKQLKDDLCETQGYLDYYHEKLEEMTL